MRLIFSTKYVCVLTKCCKWETAASVSVTFRKSGFQNWCIAHIPFPQTYVSLCRGSGCLKCCQLHASLVTESPSSGSLETPFKSSFSASPSPKTHLRVSFQRVLDEWLPVQVKIPDHRSSSTWDWLWHGAGLPLEVLDVLSVPENIQLFCNHNMINTD